ncbi:alanine dehydrogenase [Alistipes sp. ZOR0009]|uniref:alanine dehydrogenase n=1 Tax=Alistipes sp. ZOR0009 TaxID=1339253 RepID=UPI0006478E14|nr:alanine dehydrogenase [Alistipes sp. ZOR0009]
MVQENSKIRPNFPISCGLQPLEEMLEIGRKTKRLIIGIPKETTCGETRVPLTPEAVKILSTYGHEVIIESNAGKNSNFSDLHYAENGATIVQTAKEVFQSDIVIKVSPFSLEEVQLMNNNQTIISALHINNYTPDYIKGIMHKKVTAIASDGIKDSENCYPVLRSMSAIAGSTAILAAAELMSTTNKGKGVLLGSIPGITPAEVVILGASTAAEYAARAAIGLGAEVKIVDHSIKRLTEIQHLLGQRIYTSNFHPQIIEKILKTADVVVATIIPEDPKNIIQIDESLVKQMKNGAVIIDMTVDRGGSFKTSEYKTNNEPPFVKHNVIHYCIPNITSRVARTASIALSNIYTQLLLNMADAPNITTYLKENPGIRNGVYVFNGLLTNSYLGEIYNIPSKDIDLLMAAF